MQIISETVFEGIRERLFSVDVNGEVVPGVVWTPGEAAASHPLVLMGHGGSQHKKFASLANRAHKYVREFGFAVAAIDAPGHGERNPTEQGGQFVAELQAKMAAGQPVGEIVAREMERLAAQVVPEWQATLEAAQALDDVGAGGPVGYWGVSMGGAIGVYLLAAEARINAAVIGLVGLPPEREALAAAAAQVSVPVEFVLQWDDELVPRETGLALFDALGTREKSLHANPGGHVRIPAWEAESWERFFCRHLGKK